MLSDSLFTKARFLLRTTVATARREWWIHTRAYRLSILVGVFFSSLFTVASGYLVYHFMFRGQVTAEFWSYAGTSDYMTYLIVGVCVWTFYSRAQYPVRNLLVEWQDGTLESLMLSDYSRLGYHLGALATSLAYSTMEVLVLLLAAFWVGLDLSAANWAGMVLGLLASFLALFSMNLVLSATILRARDRFIVENTVLLILNAITGALFPTQYLPKAVQVLSDVIPLTWGLRMIRSSLLQGHGPADLGGQFIWLVVLTFAYSCFGLWYLPRVEQRVSE